MTTATKTKPSYPRNLKDFDDVRVACPIYIGVTQELAKKILDCLRNKSGAIAQSSGSFVSVTDNTTTNEQLAIEQRLRIDLKTLRMVLFGSMKTGINLDLALRIQKECGNEVTFVSPSVLESAIKSAISHYEFFAEETNAKTN
jgi:hypothetical protein